MAEDDLGIRIGRLAEALTKEQLAEMLAILGIARGISASHKIGDVYAPLIVEQIIRWHSLGKTRGYGTLTTLGTQVLMCRIGRDLRTAGALPPEPEREEYGDD